MPAKNRKAGAAMRGQLQTIGLLRKSGHEHFNGSLVIPVMDEHGVVTEVYGRKITPNLRKGTPSHLYLPGPHVGMFNIASFAATDEIILCESLIDALTFWAAGFRNVTASYGTSGFTDELMAAFKTHGIQRVLIAYDRDDACNNAAETLAKKLQAAGLEAFRILFPKGMDANEYALKVQPAAKSLGLAIRKAEWVTGVSHCATAESAPVITTATEVDSGLAGTNDTDIDLLSSADDGPDRPLAAVIEDAPAAAAPPSLVASPVPAAPASPADDIEAEQSEREVVMVLGERRYRVRGLHKNLSFEQLKVNVLVARTNNAAFHVDTLDLYSARHRGVYVKCIGGCNR